MRQWGNGAMGQWGNAGIGEWNGGMAQIATLFSSLEWIYCQPWAGASALSGVTTGALLARSGLMDARGVRLDALEARTRRFAVDVVRTCQKIPVTSVLGVMARQLVKAATSVAVNHRAVRRSRSLREFAAKLQIVNEEIDEAVHWLEVIQETDDAATADVSKLIQEGRELRAIFATARKTTRLGR